jgi:tripartite-type tricarboxylate transporter receptor subunit TctC
VTPHRPLFAGQASGRSTFSEAAALNLQCGRPKKQKEGSMLRLLRFLALACASLALFARSATVQAQSYPTRAITIIVPYPAGGPTDTVARFLASKFNESFGVAVIVDNRPGAGGLLGTQYAARAEKDGHTLLLTTSIVMNLVMFKEPGYRYEDMIPISTVSDSPMLLCVRVDLPVNNIREFVAYAKARPGQLNAGVIGTAGTYQLLMGSLRENAGLNIVDVTYKGAADGLRDLISPADRHVFYRPAQRRGAISRRQNQDSGDRVEGKGRRPRCTHNG